MATVIQYGGGSSLEVKAEATAPKYGSQLVGYTGYVPGMKYHYGRNFAQLSSCLAECVHNHKHPAIGFGHVCPDNIFTPEEIKRLDEELSKNCKDRKLMVDLPPGYSGTIPKYAYVTTGLKIGSGNIKALSEYVKMKRRTDEELQKLRCRQKCSCCLEPIVCEDEVTEMLRNPKERVQPCGFPSRKPPMEPPMVGYMGYVPRTKVLLETSGMDHWKETCFGIVTFDCLQKHYDAELKKPCVDYTTEVMSPVCLDPPAIHRIYMQDGMVPRYTGVVPENVFEFGKTFGDSARSMECCYHGEPNYGIFRRKKLEAQPVEEMQIIT